MATGAISYVDIGAIQRREAADGSPTARTSYVDIGAVQRQEAAAAGGAFIPIVGRGPGMALAGSGGLAG